MCLYIHHQLELEISHEDATIIVNLVQKPSTQAVGLPLTQSAASMATKRQTFSTKSPAIDSLLCGGLPRGDILEISGPPGTPKEMIAVNIAVSFLEAGHEVLFVGRDGSTCFIQE
jgi:RAD51-like protein 2